MIQRYKFFFCLALLSTLLLSACDIQFVKKDEATQDLFEVERLAIEAYENNDWAESEKHYIVLARKIPERSIHWFRLGNIYASTQRPDAAVSAYREALIRDPKMAKAWYNMGVLQLKQAANSFDQLHIYVNQDDPLYTNGQELFSGIVDLIQGNDNESASPE